MRPKNTIKNILRYLGIVIVLEFILINVGVCPDLRAESEIIPPQSILRLSEPYDTNLNVQQGVVEMGNILNFSAFADDFSLGSEQDLKDLIAAVRKIYTSQVTTEMTDDEVLALLRSKFTEAGVKGKQSVTALVNPIMGGMFEQRVQREFQTKIPLIKQLAPSVSRVEISLNSFNFPDVDIDIRLYETVIENGKKFEKLIDNTSAKGKDIWVLINEEVGFHSNIQIKANKAQSVTLNFLEKTLGKIKGEGTVVIAGDVYEGMSEDKRRRLQELVDSNNLKPAESTRNDIEDFIRKLFGENIEQGKAGGVISESLGANIAQFIRVADQQGWFGVGEVLGGQLPELVSEFQRMNATTGIATVAHMPNPMADMMAYINKIVGVVEDSGLARGLLATGKVLGKALPVVGVIGDVLEGGLALEYAEQGEYAAAGLSGASAVAGLGATGIKPQITKNM